MALLLRKQFVQEKSAKPEEALCRVGIIHTVFISTLAVETGNRLSMEGEKKSPSPRSSKGKKAKLNSGSIQEYDFFVTREEGETEEAAPADHTIRARKKGGKKKSRSFFLSN
ncbi:MAG: hypothetical protein C0390_09355 [Syntrophus sp. (in: bacteria)]|nr:hypothetical protein [Syntrophus sp. (in: bacteria)]